MGVLVRTGKGGVYPASIHQLATPPPQAPSGRARSHRSMALLCAPCSTPLFALCAPCSTPLIALCAMLHAPHCSCALLCLSCGPRIACMPACPCIPPPHSHSQT